MPIRIEVIGDTAEAVLAELASLSQVLIDRGVAPSSIEQVGTVAGKTVTKDPLDGNHALQEALTLLRKHYENKELRPEFKSLLAEFQVKAFGDIKADRGVSLLARVAQILQSKGVE